VDIRYFPKQEQENVDEMIAKMKSKTATGPKPESEEPGAKVEDEPHL
jgi:hypothetical protein